MREEIVSAGFGGQGIMVLGKLLSLAAMREGKNVTWMPSYGAEVRGGTAHSMTIISAEPIASPLVSEPTSCIVMNVPSFMKFKDRIKKGGLFVINSSLVKDAVKRKDLEVFKLPATEIANRLGNVKVANMVLLGAYLKRRGTASLKTAASCLKDIFSDKDNSIISLNEDAIKKGWEEASAKG